MFNLNQTIMKSRKLLLGLALIALAFTSCKDERQERAQRNVDTYAAYVDSLGKLPAEDARTNWASINSTYQTRTSEAEAALVNLKNKEKAQVKINASKAKYDALNRKIEADINSQRQTASNTETQSDMSARSGTQAGTGKQRVAGSTGKQPLAGSTGKQQLRNSLFGAGKVGNDMSFNWVNKDNIHSVYQNFVHTVENNKSKYTREDWDEIKLMYEALDSRKNTVEKEGLSASDNHKIAALKLKFAPMYTVNRLSAKSRENEEAKKK
jgi:hypothetical protein